MVKRIIQLDFAESAAGRTASLSPAVGQSIVQKDMQSTLPSKPLNRSFPRQTLGDSGTRMLHGIVYEEYNPDLQGVQGVRVFDEMRKNDGTCRAVMLVCTLPIRRANWFVKAANETPEAIEQAEMVRRALFEWLDLSWDDVLRQALLMAAFGVMLFEKVYTTIDDPVSKKTYVTLKRLAPRLPKSILMWELTDQTFGIQQIRQDGVVAQIPGSKLLIFVNEREGDNWWGTSMMRGAYKHWFYKNNFYKIDAVATERQGLGVPYIKMPQGYTENDERNAKTALTNLRASESAYMILPPEYEFGFADMGARGTRDPSKSIEHHNKEILQSVLAQFLELGASKSGSGSRALSQDHSDLFLKAEEAMANTIRDVFNKDQIRELVDLNFDNVEAYPALEYEGITKMDIAALGTALSSLTTSGFLSPTDSDQQWIRAALGMPARTPEEISEDDQGEPTQEEMNQEGVEEEEDIEDDTTPPATPAKKTTPKKPAPAAPAAPAADSKKVDKASKSAKDKPTDKTPQTKATAHDHSTDRVLKRKFDDGHGFMSWRPIMMAEESVDWSKIQTTLDKMEGDFTAKARELLNAAKDAYMAKIHKAIESGDPKAIATLETNFQNDYKGLLKTAMADAYDFGKNKASNEIGVAVPASNANTIASMDLLATTIAQKTAADLEAKARLSAATAITNEKNALQSAGQIDANLVDVIDKSLDSTAPTMIGVAFNNGRNDVFERNGGMIYALQRSEILDKKTCNFCLSMDGRIVSPDDEWTDATVFHTNCRGIWVAIMDEETNKPPIESVPGELGDYYGGEVNSVVQPKAPIVKPGGLADMYLKRQAAAAKESVS